MFVEIFENRTNGKWQHRCSSSVPIGIDHVSVVHFPIDIEVSILSVAAVANPKWAFRLSVSVSSQRVEFYKNMSAQRLLVQLHRLFELFGTAVRWELGRDTSVRTERRVCEQDACGGHQIRVPGEQAQRIQFDVWDQTWVSPVGSPRIDRSNLCKSVNVRAGNQIETNRTTVNATIQSDLFQSPFFPNFYPRDLSIEHIFTCDDGLNGTDCTLEVTFSDFQISSPSSIEVSRIVYVFAWNAM